MRCPYCDYLESKVLDSRPTDEGASIRRRRECIRCNQRFTTYERVEDLPLMVKKKSGGSQVFDRNKILNGLIKSCEKRPVSLQQMEEIVDDIEKALRNKMVRETTSEEIGEMIMARLKDVDEVAYVRFASVYRQFRDVESFMRELEELVRDKKE
ncbi:transcriptional regulator NrdR [Peptoniphilus sp. KCTC 25270]|uniref:transcriptional regulator NrdR n=1 Tax=Peptoniphilus sp. KCTC 25270 TaxID=2897414 RepID=UPI001E3C836F|nr:transcriptional regulator NrdR [Peptoniphilus sp. KCTC 25270]MCD1147184.1 transcriptional regulator NrdR [Peptoniphilus sp. KCTC 25270]